MTKTQKALAVYKEYFKGNVSSDKRSVQLGEEFGFNRRLLSYLKSIDKAVSSEGFAILEKAITENKSVMTAKGQRIKALGTLARVIKKGDSIVSVTDEGCSVYLIQAGDYYKIGVAYNTLSRLITTQTHNPLEVVLIHTIRKDTEREARDLEAALFNKFKSSRIRGEWFRLSKHEVDDILKL